MLGFAATECSQQLLKTLKNYFYQLKVVLGTPHCVGRLREYPGVVSMVSESFFFKFCFTLFWVLLVVSNRDSHYLKSLRVGTRWINWYMESNTYKNSEIQELINNNNNENWSN